MTVVLHPTPVLETDRLTLRAPASSASVVPAPGASPPCVASAPEAQAETVL